MISSSCKRRAKLWGTGQLKKAMVRCLVLSISLTDTEHIEVDLDQDNACVMHFVASLMSLIEYPCGFHGVG